MTAGIRARTGLRVGAPLALSVLMLAVGCTNKAPPSTAVVRPVKTMVVLAGDDLHVRSFPGKVEASRKAELTFQVAGTLVQFPVKEGQKVAKGDLIAQLRQDEFEARLQALQGRLDKSRAELRALRSGERPEQIRRLDAQLRAAEAKLTNAQSMFDRDRRLFAQRAIAREEFEKSQTAFRVAQEEFRAAREAREKGTIAREEEVEAKEGVVRGLEAQVVEANVQLEDSTMRAPYDGVVAKRFVELDKNVTPNQPVVKFQDVDEIAVAVDVPETVMAADLRSADLVQIVAEFTAAPGLQFPVHIKEMAQKADPVTQTFRVRVSMKTPEGVTLLPGMSATVRITYRRARIIDSRILVPISAVVKDESGEQVTWVLGPEQTVSRRRVKIGEATGGQIEVLEGLQPGERIAIAGASSLREGMKVRDLGDELGGGQ